MAKTSLFSVTPEGTNWIESIQQLEKLCKQSKSGSSEFKLYARALGAEELLEVDISYLPEIITELTVEPSKKKRAKSKK